MYSNYLFIDLFQVLIEKEFMSFGHKFAERYGHAEEDVGDSQRSPIFPQVTI
ncbi:MAG: hypothetical protein IBJ04_05320 [Hydrogenophaga sp.]|nr:hypothetical protein [Hydrogenophaga sp.]